MLLKCVSQSSPIQLWVWFCPHVFDLQNAKLLSKIEAFPSGTPEMIRTSGAQIEGQQTAINQKRDKTCLDQSISELFNVYIDPNIVQQIIQLIPNISKF